MLEFIEILCPIMSGMENYETEGESSGSENFGTFRSYR